MDILFCSAPGTFSDRPTLAPAVLKACVESAGFSSTAIDLNIEVYNLIQQHPRRALIEDFFKQQHIHPDITDDIGDLLDYCADRIVNLNPPVLGLSLLTQDSQFFTVWLCYHLKIVKPDLKIVIGGSGIKAFVAETTINFAELLRNKGYIDDYINGDGEYSVVEYLRGNLDYPGINSGTWQAIQDLNSLPQPNFTDYNFTQYAEPGIPLCDSRGCVRTCEFCDIIEHWKRYQYRTADNIFAEIQRQIDQHGITQFFFYNSLTNGNMKEFLKLLDLICEYNQQHPSAQISWDGYFIVRNARQHPEEFWQKIKLSNGYLQLGIESVVEPVRVALGKNFTNEDIDYHLAMAKKHQVPLLLLMIVGYPTETHADFEFTQQWFRDRAHYAGNPIKSVVLSLSAILPNTQLERKQQEYGIVRGQIPTVWLTQINAISTQDRLDHFNKLNNLLIQLNMGPTNGGDNNITTIQQELAL
jgi:hypothetical protein